jgi:polyferredoxin
MVTKFSEPQAQTKSVEGHNRALQFILWTIWSIFVIGFALFRGISDLNETQHVDIVRLIIHTSLAGMIGLIVLTLVEMRLDPERFVE